MVAGFESVDLDEIIRVGHGRSLRLSKYQIDLGDLSQKISRDNDRKRTGCWSGGVVE
jgi:hypothetical protein